MVTHAFIKFNLWSKGSKSLGQQGSMAEDNWSYDQGQVLVKEK